MYMNPPASFDVIDSNIDEEVKLKWKHVKGAKNYLVEYKGSSKGEKWKQADFVSGSFCIITGLKKKRKYKFRVAALNSTKRSKWSKICERRPEKNNSKRN